MSESSVKKIFTVSLLGRQRVKCLAAYNGEVLVVSALEPISGVFGSWRKTLAEECQKHAQEGFIVLVEERATDHFAQYGQRLLFDDLEPEEKRTYQNIGLDLYFALTAMGDSSGNRFGNLVMNSGLERHLLTSNTVNVEQDEKGRNRYDMDQERFSGYHRAMLLAVLGAQLFNPVDSGYLDEFYRLVGGEIHQPRHKSTMQSVIKHHAKNGGLL